VANRTLLTIGHSARAWEDFLEILRAHKVKRLIDVRRIPRSRRYPHFSQQTLAANLQAAKIAYVHLPTLGGLRKARQDSINTGWRNPSFRGYADYMQTAEFDAALKRLITLGVAKRTVIMCAEAVPWRCHRSLIADALVGRGVSVEHIMSDAAPSRHALTSFARLTRGRVTYPSQKSKGRS
jgi:uncharacterized protein (DUF488 family)